jgi:cysteine desulfuration protein SufE
MPDRSTPTATIPPGVERILRQFRMLGREEKMQALVSYSRKLEPVPDRFRDLPRAEFTVPECQTRVDLFPEFRDGRMHYWADVNVRESPTVAAFLAILFQAVNDQPPESVLAVPQDFVREMMADIGLGTREVGLNAMLARVKRHAALSVAPGGPAAGAPGSPAA